MNRTHHSGLAGSRRTKVAPPAWRALIRSIVALAAILVMEGCGGAARDIQLIDTTYGGGAGSMNGRILVVYGSRGGATAEVADRIGKTLASDSTLVDVKPAAEVTDISGYTAVVIGSGIRVGKVYSEITEFTERFKADLATRPVAFFVVCLTMKDDNPKNREITTGFLAPLRAIVTPVSEGLFAGIVDYKKLGFFAGFIFKRFIKVPEGDYRDWDAIEAWANGLKGRFSGRQ